jgi:hypothetical protein
MLSRCLRASHELRIVSGEVEHGAAEDDVGERFGET